MFRFRPAHALKSLLALLIFAVSTLAHAVDDGATIDVMVVYTPAARISQGGTAAMKALIDSAVSDTNQAYANSQVIQRVRLVYAGEVNYTEVDLITDRDRIQAINDGFLDEVHALRNLYGADIVSLWGNYPVPSGCGQSFVMLTEAAAFESQAINVINRTCHNVNRYTFAHELGHNMGLLHDTVDAPENTSVTPEGSQTLTSINYAHGYIDAANQFSSIMAISPCSNCLRIPYYSNPNVNYLGAPTGNGAAQEFRVLNDTRETVANFRASVNLAGPGTIVVSPLSFTVNEAAGTVTIVATRHAGASGAVSLRYATVAETATPGVDYVPQSGTLTWGDGETGSKAITVVVQTDGVVDGPKTFSVLLDAPGGGVGIGTLTGVSATASILINDIDTDNFPVGCNFPAIGWANTQPGWAVATDSFFGASCSLKSNATANGQSARLQFQGEFLAGNVSFARRVSSQSGNDCLRFLIDNVAQNIGGTCNGAGGAGASGDVPWSVVTVPITAGSHTLVWSYEKDASGIDGADAAWIDALVLPIAGPPIILSAPPPNGFLNIPYAHNFVATGAAPITFSLSGALPPGVTLSPSGLLSGTPTAIGAGPYSAFIRAENSILSFERQLISIAITGLAPNAPSISAITAKKAEANVYFTSPVSAGSTAITAYTATCNPNAVTATGATSPIIVTGLTNDTEYTCSVTAANSFGASPASPPAVVLLPTVPGAPSIGAAAAGNASALLNFTPPTSDGRTAITAYTASCNPGGVMAVAAFSPVSVANLVNGVAYTCSITATNAVGTGLASGSVSVTPSLTAAPTLAAVFSRKVHGAAGVFDLIVNATPSLGSVLTVESRVMGTGHNIHFRFTNAITSVGSVNVIDGNNAPVSASVKAQGNDVIVTLPTLKDNSRVTISLTGLVGTAGPVTAPAPLSMGFLVGDVSNSRAVNASDLSSIRARIGAPLSAGNFQFNVTASGSIGTNDISVAKARAGLQLK